ncbi:hypothetical protein KSS87_022991, partial [Heliosperma pusillum]
MTINEPTKNPHNIYRPLKSGVPLCRQINIYQRCHKWLFGLAFAYLCAYDLIRDKEKNGTHRSYEPGE